MARIARVVGAKVERYADTGQVVATVYWRDTLGCYGATTGDPKNAHMSALLRRATIEGEGVRTS